MKEQSRAGALKAVKYFPPQKYFFFTTVSNPYYDHYNIQHFLFPSMNIEIEGRQEQRKTQQNGDEKCRKQRRLIHRI